jgi:hypothetical protein
MSDQPQTGQPEEIPRRPLRPKTEAGADAQPDSSAAGKPVKRVSLPSLEEADAHMEYAAHRADPPADMSAPEPVAEAAAEPPEEVVDDAAAPDDARPVASNAISDGVEEVEKELSSGFILGIALVVVVLVFGLVMARMHGRINRLESRISKVEGPPPPTTVAP